MSKLIAPNPRLLTSLSKNACSQPIRTGPTCRNISTSTSVLGNSRRMNRSGDGAATRCLQAVRRDGVALGGYEKWTASGRAGSGSGSVRGYKTVQEAKSRYKSGVCFLLSHAFCSSTTPSVLYPRADKITAFLHPRGNPLPQQRRRTDLLLSI